MDWDDSTSVLKALALLYSLQTPQEQDRQNTVEDNDIGFNAIDAGFLSSVAEQMLVQKRGVSTKQFALVRTKLRKYERQIEVFTELGHLPELPETAIVYESKNGNEKYDGVIRVDNDRLLFEPFTDPSKQVIAIGYRWAQDGSQSWESPLTI